MNETGVALASAARTATTTSSTLENPRGRGVVLFLDVTVASGTGGLQVQAQAIDPTGGTALAVNSAPTVRHPFPRTTPSPWRPDAHR